MLEEKISNIIHDQCLPVIHPEISFLIVDKKHIVKIHIFKGSAPPYYLKNKGKEIGTYIRVGSSNRQASSEIIEELERQYKNISFDSELSHHTEVDWLNIDSFKSLYQEKTGEPLTAQVLKKLDLFKTEQTKNLPTNALILLSDDEIRKQFFPYAKIECARFKGTIPGNFIDQKTIDENIGIQAEQAYQFVLRHISEGSVDYTGVFRKDRWEYPVIAIREAIRNAVIHRDYSLTGMDIKIAIFDDKLEITSPGKLLPSVDFNDMEAGQSDIRNKVLAPVFKKMGIIEQWGNGLRLIAGELHNYPEIGFEWKEPGMAFRLSFLKKNVITDTSEKTSEKILELITTNKYITIKELSENIGVSSRSVERNIKKLQAENKLKRVGADKGGHWEILK
ncbi:MAG: ATP-binding protein [Bacteroidales bacterium]